MIINLANEAKSDEKDEVEAKSEEKDELKRRIGVQKNARNSSRLLFIPVPVHQCTAFLS